MKKYAKIINEDTKEVQIGTGTNTDFYQSIGMTDMEVEQAYNGCWYVKGYAPQQTTEELNAQAKQNRASAYSQEVDNLMSEYTRKEKFNLFEEGEAESLMEEIQNKVAEIKERYPYIIE